MGMPGMNAADAVKYAAEVPKSNKPAESCHPLTVAEFRNSVNPVIHYYDTWDVKDFFGDTSIPWKTKMLAILGKIPSEVISEDAVKSIIERK